MNIKQLQAYYPFVNMVEYPNVIGISDESASWNVGKNTPHLEEYIAYLNLMKAYENLLRAQYPYLYIACGTIPGVNNAKFPSNPKAWVVWIRYNYDREEVLSTMSGAATQFSFMYPPTEEDCFKLEELNKKAQMVAQNGMFYCTQCDQVYPKTEFGGFYYAEVRCKTCATPEWKKQAARENYD